MNSSDGHVSGEQQVQVYYGDIWSVKKQWLYSLQHFNSPAVFIQHYHKQGLLTGRAGGSFSHKHSYLPKLTKHVHTHWVWLTQGCFMLTHKAQFIHHTLKTGKYQNEFLDNRHLDYDVILCTKFWSEQSLWTALIKVLIATGINSLVAIGKENLIMCEALDWNYDITFY